MKKISVLFVAMFCTAGLIFAQESGQGNAGRPPQRGPRGQDVPVTSVSGKLAWVDGKIAVKAGEKTYFASGIRRLIGFVDSIKEGSDVKLEGREFPGGKDKVVSFFQTLKVSSNGKEYDIPDRPPQRFNDGGRGDGRRGNARPPSRLGPGGGRSPHPCRS
ncbi:MAG: hypothetical protein LBS82_03605 [Spirochaetaceae bacterium]|nr:hypothetical protein [Spirochaetaceae bacterium]